jgi:hypothetical protein
MAVTPGEELSAGELVQEAVDRAGAAAKAAAGGEPLPFVDNLERLVTSCAATAALNPLGRQVLRKVAVRHLRNLLDFRAYVAAHPDVSHRPLPPALVVTGLPRTGTTLLHNLLALDPDHRVLRVWEALRPGGGTRDALVDQAERWLAGFYTIVPEFRAIHPAEATGPEECDALLQNAFASQHFDDMFDARAYSEWFARAPLVDEYACYALQLRVLSSSSDDTGSWALKSPGHLGHLDALLAALPVAAVVVCHRHPFEAVASYASLVHTLRRAYSDRVSAAEVGGQALARTATAMARATAVRDAAPATRFVDVSYRELVRDPVRCAAAVYQACDRPLAAGVEDSMRRWVSANPAGRHGRHSYDLARFRLTEAGVERAFAPYLERFGPLVEG